MVCCFKSRTRTMENQLSVPKAIPSDGFGLQTCYRHTDGRMGDRRSGLRNKGMDARYSRSSILFFDMLKTKSGAGEGHLLAQCEFAIIYAMRSPTNTCYDLREGQHPPTQPYICFFLSNPSSSSFFFHTK